jgi:hypothetical protein
MMELVSDDNSEVTPVAHYSALERKAAQDGYVHSSLLARFIGRVACSGNYISSVSYDEILERAYSAGERAEFRALQQACKDSLRELFERAEAHVTRLGTGYRQRLTAEIIHDRVMQR